MLCCAFPVLPTIQVECATPTITALYGEDITLPCLARGNPPVTTVWTRDGEVVDSTVSRVTVLSQGLHVAAVMEADSAIYNCTVVNVIMGEVFMDTYAQRLLVQSEPSILPSLPPSIAPPRRTSILHISASQYFCGEWEHGCAILWGEGNTHPYSRMEESVSLCERRLPGSGFGGGVRWACLDIRELPDFQ